MSNSFSILGVMPTVPGAVSGELPTFTSNGIVQDSGYSVNSSVLGGSNTTIPTSYVVLQAIGGAITSSKSFRGGYDASSNVFPSTGGSGAAGAILSGDVWNITVAGTLGGNAVVSGNTILALTDSPGQTDSNWLISNTLTDVIVSNPTTGEYLRFNGSSWVNANIQAGDIPTLNQNTTGYAAGISAGALGSLPYQSAANTTLFVSPNTTTTKKVLKETGTGSAGQAPVLEQATVTECSDYTTTTNFTPTLINTTPGDLAITYTVQNGRYVKIGNVCFVNVFILTSSFTHTNSTGAWQISGLPIAAANNGQQAIGTCAVQGVTKAGYTQFFGEIDAGSSVVALAASGSGVGYSTISGNSQMPTGGTVLIDLSITYFI